MKHSKSTVSSSWRFLKQPLSRCVFGGIPNWKCTVTCLSADNNLPCSAWNHYNHYICFGRRRQTWIKPRRNRDKDLAIYFLSLITVLAMATAKDEQEQTEEMQNIKGQNKETYSWLCILKYLLHFNMVQMSKSSEEKVSWEASAHTYGRHELRGHYEKVLFVKNNHNLSYLGPEILQGFQHNHEVMPDSPLWRTTWAEEMFLWAGTVCPTVHMPPV